MAVFKVKVPGTRPISSYSYDSEKHVESVV